ncbi:histidine phosphatase family protein [Schumannella luteola]|uniref:Broad specificity phosphatase PhoE n=1 Tax=Schumannella luteola TaxID=472059 RepID=A0A852YK47_9MICO|nr:broad specificity phosphatase PhoE [Schumannella luteola]TPX01576.1 histidine phosphatase family protein [Schumannella luteola]
MPADRIHLVRHGEVHNPERVLYGRLPGYRLSELGERMADAAAASHADHPPVRLFASPLQRTQESAAPWAERYGLEIVDNADLIEPANRFEGTNVRTAIRDPRSWPWLVNPWRPSWGEAFTSIAARMMRAVDTAWNSVDSGEVVLVSHQLPIWMVARTVAGQRLAHDPRARRCTLSSITSLEKRDGRFVEVDYQEPARDLLAQSTDLGAV